MRDDKDYSYSPTIAVCGGGGGPPNIYHAETEISLSRITLSTSGLLLARTWDHLKAKSVSSSYPVKQDVSCSGWQPKGFQSVMLDPECEGHWSIPQDTSHFT